MIYGLAVEKNIYNFDEPTAALSFKMKGIQISIF